MKPYDIYFKTGFYDKRYPGPNPAVLDIIRSCVKNRKTIALDYGCGNGRYLVPLAGLENVSSLTGFDISETALAILEKRLEQSAEKKCKTIHLTTDFKEVIRRSVGKKRVNLALILFGVYSCVMDADHRKAILKQVIHVMDHENNRLILSVPNQYRRFWLSQLKHRGSCLKYRRKYNEHTICFTYKLFTKKEIIHELEDVGFTVLNVQPQSILSEYQVTHSPFLAEMDKKLSALLPVTMSYDYLVEATYIPG